MPEALPELLWIAVLLFAFAFAWTVRRMVQALFGALIGALQSIPLIGRSLAAPFTTIENSIVNALGRAEHAIDGVVGASFHFMARQAEWLWREIKSHAGLLALIASVVGPVGTAISALRALVHALTHGGHITTSRVKTLERELHGVEHKVRHIEQELAHGIGADVLPRIRSLDRELHRVEHRVIPALEADVATAEGDVTALGRWVKDHALLAGTTALTGAVAWALSQLGLGGLRCNTLARSLGSRGCGLWSGLENLLGWFVDAFIVTDLCEIIPLLETAYSDVAAPAVTLLTEAIDSMPCVSGKQPPALTGPAFVLPSVYFTGNLTLP